MYVRVKKYQTFGLWRGTAHTDRNSYFLRPHMRTGVLVGSLRSVALSLSYNNTFVCESKLENVNSWTNG